MSHKNTVDTMKLMVDEVAQTEKELEKSAPQSEESIEAMKAQLAEMEEQNNVIESKIDEMWADLVDYDNVHIRTLFVSLWKT